MRRTTRWNALLAFAAAVLAAGPAAQDPLGLLGDGDKVTATARFEPPVARPGEVVQLVVELEVAPGWHVYGSREPQGIPPSVTLEEAGPLQPAGELEVPPGERHEAFGMESWWLQGEVELVQPWLVPPDAEPGTVEVEGVVDYTVCNDRVCDPPARTGLSATLEVEAGAAREELLPAGGATAEPGGPGEAGEAGGAGATAAGTESGSIEAMPLLLFLLLAVGWGLFTLAMPCTYPMIPITISFFTKQADQRGGAVLPLALTYGAGIVAIFVLIGVVIGEPIVTFAVHPVTNLVIAVLFFLFALVLFGVIDLQPPAFLMRAADRASGQGGYVGVFLMGATLVVTSFTCTAPFVGSLLAIGAEGGDLGRLVLGMAVFGLTMALPFVALSLVPGKLRAIPRSGEWMQTLKVFLGFVELAAAFKFLSNSDLAWHWQWLTRELFLFLWAGIFLLAALYLLGLVRLHGAAPEIGPVRLVGGLAVLMLAVYCAYGAAGNRMDGIMSSIAPPYSNRVAWAEDGAAGERGHEIVVDDYEAARTAALAEDKLLLLNFTGVT